MKKRKVGVFASRVVPNGVDATTAEWEGGAVPFICAGDGDLFPCAQRKKRFYHHLLVKMSKPFRSSLEEI